MSVASPISWTDTHVHLDAFRDDGERDDVLQRAREAGVTRLIAIGGNAVGNEVAVASAQRPGVWATVGYDRDQTSIERLPGRLDEWLKNPRVVAVGEIGLDYYYSLETAAAQKALFEEMLEKARRHARPCIIHSRWADDDTLAILRNHASSWKGPSECMAVLHCYTGGPAFAEKLLELGLMISFSGIITFRNADELRQVAPIIPDDRLLVETDSPFLAPVPYRGKKNEPAFLVAVAEKVAQLRGVEPAELAATTHRNADRLFGLAVNK
jgi:TatD DNase family protein